MFTKKQLCDEAIFEGRLDEFYLEWFVGFLKESNHNHHGDFLELFETLGAYILRERYELHIDDLLEKNIRFKEDVVAFYPKLLGNLDSIDTFFERFYRKQKSTYLAVHPESKPFFHDYHRRDLKQDSMLRAFIIIRNRLMRSEHKELMVSKVQIHRSQETQLVTQTFLKISLSPKGIERLIEQGEEAVFDILQNYANLIATIGINSRIESDVHLESEPFEAVFSTNGKPLKKMHDQNNSKLQIVLKIVN